MEKIKEIDEVHEEKVYEEEKRKMKVVLRLIRLAQLLLLLVLCSLGSRNLLVRIVWEPGAGESIYEKLLKTSGDVHANPGPANKTEREIKEKYAGEKMLTVEHMDPSACGSLGLTSDGKYKFAVDKAGYTCQGSACNANQAKNTWQDWSSFQAHCHEHHKVNITNDHRKDKSITCMVFTDEDMKKCNKCPEKFYTTRNKKRHMDKKHFAHARFEILSPPDSNSQESLSPSATNSLPE